MIGSNSFGPLAAELRRAESSGHDISAALPKIVAQRRLDDAEDIGAVLISRLRHATRGSKGGVRRAPKLIAGLVPVADGEMSAGMRKSLVEHEDHMEKRATAVAETAVAEKAEWLRKLGPVPTDPLDRDLWMQDVRIVAAYRDRWGVKDVDSPVGSAGTSDRHRVDEARARKAVRRAADRAASAGARATGSLKPERPGLG